VSDEISSLRIRNQSLLEKSIIIIGQQLEDAAGEHRRLNDQH
jgi:hypothetical protein